VLGDHALGLRLAREAVARASNESAYRVTLIRMLLAEGRTTEAREALAQLQTYNIAGRLDATIAELRRLFPAR
jgi:thioredoxin-like negative regulator of GroEL